MILLILSAALAQEPLAPPAVVAPARPPAAAGSLWVESQAQMLAGLDGNARAVGDLITVRIVEASSTQITAGTTTSRNSTANAGITSLFGLERSVTAANDNMGGAIALGVGSDSAYDGSGDTSRRSAVEGILTCQVVEVLPNGNLRIYGTKDVRANREVQHLALTGIVRLQDIQADNTVDSSLLAESIVEITGNGVISDKQGPGLGTRVLDHAWPF